MHRAYLRSILYEKKSTSATRGVKRYSLLAVHLLIGLASVPNIEQGIGSSGMLSKFTAVCTTPVGSNRRTAMEFQEPVLFISKSSLQRSPLGEARLQWIRAEVLVEIGCIGYRQIWHPWLGSRNAKAPIHRAITTQAVLQGVAAQTRLSTRILLPERTVALYYGLYTSNHGRQCATLRTHGDSGSSCHETTWHRYYARFEQTT
ncbi:hypothetical protein LI328DRAFT_157265 [Trichoderma asperelloides]|nr:hypothetical protein LI328DRAFT_157265 [Trichoderma asperelloides]